MLLSGIVTAGAQTSYHISVENGLATNTLTTLIRDHLGYMWTGSYNGLHQHQGTRIRVYNRVGRDSLSLSSSEVTSLYEDRAGNIWVGTTGGLDCMNPATGHVRHYTIKTTDKADNALGYIYSVFEDREGYIWAACDAVLVRLSPGDGQYHTYYAGKGSHNVPATGTGYNEGLGDENGFWLSTSAGLAYYNYRSHSFLHRYNSGNPIFALDRGSNGSAASDMCLDDSGSICFIANGTMLVRFAPGSGKMDTVSFHTPDGSWYCCYSLSCDYKGNIWIGFRHGGILVFNPASKTFTPIRSTQQSGLIQSDFVIGLREDFQHHMWVTTDDGADVIDYYQKGFQLFHLSDSASYKKLQLESGIMSYNNRKQLTIPFQHGQLFTFSTTTDSIAKSTWTAATYSPNLPDGQGATPIVPDAAAQSRMRQYGRIIWTYERAGIRYEKYFHSVLLRIERDGTVRQQRSGGFVKRAGVSHDGASLFFLGDDDNLVRQQIVSGRMDTFDVTTALKPLGFTYFAPRDLTDDGQGNIWITTQNGLIRYTPSNGKATVFTTSQGLVHNFTFAVVTDHSGTVWASSLGGVDWYDAASGKFRNAVKYRDGTYMDAFGSSLKTEDGTLYFHSGNKLLRIRPDVFLHASATPPRLLINEVLVNGRQVGSAQHAALNELSRQENRIVFHYGLLDYSSASGDARLQHRLDGLETEWTNDAQGEAAFNALPPGKYRFQVRALGQDGRVLDTAVSGPVYIHPAFWQTWWAKVLTLLIVAAAVSLLVRRRITTIKQKASLKQQLTELESRALRAQMNPHFIFNSLNAIQELVIREDSTAAYQYLSKFSKLLRMVLQRSEQSSIPLSDELEMYQLYLALEDLRFNHTFCYLIRIDEPLDPEATYIPPLLLQPYLENAIWHGLMHKSGAKVLDVHFAEQDEHIVCTITDNGIGREAAALLRKGKLRPHGDASRGMTLSQHRIALLNKNDTSGTGIIIKDLTDEAGNPSGTQVIVTLAITEHIA